MLTMGVCVPPMMAAPPPESWATADYPAQPATWYAVEIQSFPSAILAEGVREALVRARWEPVYVLEKQGSGHRVLLGETTDVAEAWFFAHEISDRQVAAGHVVTVPAAPRDPRGVEGLLRPDLGLAWETDADGVPLIQKQALARVQSFAADIDPADKEKLTELVTLVEGGRSQSPGVAVGAIAAAEGFWRKRVEPEVTLYLASQVATDQWPAAADEREVKARARDLTFQLLYGHRRDWRAAWQAARLQERTAPSEHWRARARLHQAVLLVDLVSQGREPRASFAEIRARLRAALDAAPDDARETRARIELVYLQTFAWEGNWDRVESLAREYRLRWPDFSAPHAQATLLLARSLERHQTYEQAIELVSEVIRNPVSSSAMLRMGNEVLDPAESAQASLRRLRQLALNKMAAEMAAQTARRAAASDGDKGTSPTATRETATPAP